MRKRDDILKKLELIQGWKRNGLTDRQIAKNLGVAYSTFNKYKAENKVIQEALMYGKEEANLTVENALFRKAVGCTIRKTKAFKCTRKYYDAEGRLCEEEYVATAELLEDVPPDTTAMMAWLNNNKPDKYKRNHNKETLDKERFEYEKKRDKEKDF